MKKFYTLVLTAFLALCLGACSGNTNPAPAAGSEAGSGSAVEGSAAEGSGSAEGPFAGMVLVRINTDGMGRIAYEAGDDVLEFDDEFPTQSAFTHLEPGAQITIHAKADPDWKFVKWTKDGADFSTEESITVTADADVEYRAVFEA